MTVMPVAAETPPAAGPAVSRRAVWSWALYDLANTIFSLNILSLHFSLWVVSDMGGRDGDYLLANSLSMALMFISAPLLGAISDQAPRRVPLLIATTLTCCVFTAFLGTGGLMTSLILFVIANYFYQGGLIFYDTLLPSVSTPENRGRIGGLGIGIGYIGSLIGVAVGLTVLAFDPDGRPLIFKLTALLFLLFALPCFLFVRERPREGGSFSTAAVRRAVRELRQTVARVRGYPDLRRFLIAHALYADAANTTIAIMGIYAVQEVGFGDQEVQVLLLAGIIGAIAGGLGLGRVVDRIGPKATLYRVLALWLVTLALTAAIAFFDLPRTLFWLVAVLAGLSLGGTWAADRPFMLRLAPPRYLGQFYGLYAMVGRFAAILGPLLWTAIVDGLGWGRPTAVVSLMTLIALAYIAVRPVDDGIRTWEESAQPQ